MKVKNIILIVIAVIVVIVCAVALIFGVQCGNSENKKPIDLSGAQLEDDSEKVSEKATKEKETTKEAATEEKTTEEMTTEKVTEEEAETEESTKEESTEEEKETEAESETKEETEKETATEPVIEEEPEPETELSRFSYDFLVLDGKSGYIEYNDKLINLLSGINKARSEAGRQPLILDEQLCYIACGRASEMSYTKDLNHERTDGTYYYDLMKQGNVSFSKAAENIAAGQNNAESVVFGKDVSWKTSSSHYENMVNSEYSRVGVGVDYSDSYGYIWVAIFAG